MFSIVPPGFWIREDISIRMHVEDYERYGSQAGLVGEEISWTDIWSPFSGDVVANSTLLLKVESTYKIETY